MGSLPYTLDCRWVCHGPLNGDFTRQCTEDRSVAFSSLRTRTLLKIDHSSDSQENRFLHVSALRRGRLLASPRKGCSGRKSPSRDPVGLRLEALGGAVLSHREATLSQGTSSLEKIVTRYKHEKLWRDLFSDPSQWWDNRASKPTPRYPDFKHKQTGAALWLNEQNPPWVASEIASLAQGLSFFSQAQKLSSFNKAGLFKKTIELFEQMQEDGINPDGYVFVRVLSACGALQSLDVGRRIHRQIIDTGHKFNPFVSSCLVDMYAKCGSIDEARRVFDKMPTRDVVCWTSMIWGYVKCGQGSKALELFQEMERSGVKPNSFTFVGLLNACASLAALEEGKCVHEEIIRSGCESNVYVGSSLVDMYSKCGSIDDAWRVFNNMPTRTLVAWNGMILGYAKCGEGLRALELFRQMLQEGVVPDRFTFVGALNACANVTALAEGKRCHEMIISRGLESDAYIRSSLVDMYTKCGSIDDAWRVFDEMPKRELVAWNGLIMGCAKSGGGLHAVELFQQMQREGIQPDSCTFVGVLNACARMGALQTGRHVHELIIQIGCESDLFVANSLVDMYAKCGSIDDARRVFNNMQKRNVVSWNTMIMGYSMHGQAQEAISLFKLMFQTGSEIDEVTFISLLSACCHGGMVNEGMEYFKSMRSVYGVSPNVQHYSCIVEILGRAGRLDDAVDMIRTMPFEPSAGVWISLLGACRIHGNVEIGERAASRLLALAPESVTGYVLLSNIYAAAGHWDRKILIEEQRRKMGVKKRPDRAWIELNNQVHLFTANDCQHPQLVGIQEELTRLSEQTKETGCIPDTRFAFDDAEDEDCLGYPLHHSEKLAIAFGLISTPPGVALRIVKNMRVCADCHAAIKCIAKIVGREIIIRDGNRFHHFNDGICSCRDYW